VEGTPLEYRPALPDMVLTRKELAAVLKLSQKLADELTRRDGFPLVRVGTRVLIPIEPLREWLVEQARSGR
jgi:excisionase family DNA binding protein